MSQAPLTIADGSGAAVLAEINSAFANIASLCAGSTDPSTLAGGVLPYSLWLDTTTTTNVLKQRNADNAGWNTILTINQTTGNSNLAALNIVQAFTKAQRGAIVALTDGATITPDFSLGNNYSVTLAGNRTLANPTNLVAGQTGSIFITQDATGSRTLAYGSSWKFAGGVVPTLSTGANAVDRIDYTVRTTSSIHAVLTANVS